MKIAIQGHPKRCKEVIDTLINLGGINKYDYEGNDSDLCYCIDESNHIEGKFISKIGENFYKCYTLEEFEKEFPFKIGDKVKDCSDNEIGTIFGFINIYDELMYVVNFEQSGYANMPTEELKPYKSMKKERNITLTLDKAKEWYNKGGELREIALQAYTKEELNPFPKSWEEYCKGYKVPAMIFGPCIPNKYVALWRLERLRDCYRQGWKPDWKDCYTEKYCIVLNSGKPLVSLHGVGTRFLAFQSKEVAEDFLKNFDHLIKEAGDLI